MLADLPGHEMWNEPYVGALFGNLYEAQNGDEQGRSFILGPSLRHVWLPSIRSMVLDGAAARYPQLLQGGYLVIKEPNGCLGSRLLLEALPESRVILMLRDPRDVIASNLDSHRAGSWTANNPRWRGKTKPVGAADKNPAGFVRHIAGDYMRNFEVARSAYESHSGRKVLVKYEDLRKDPLSVIVHTYSELGIPVGKEELAQAIERHAWEKIPSEETGSGRFYRKAVPGAWRDDLSGLQVTIVEEGTRPILDEFYSHVAMRPSAGALDHG